MRQAYPMTRERSGGRVFLSATHAKMLVGDSAISREIVAARRYCTARTAADVPPEFGRGQRRRGLVIPTYCPCGATGHQLRPDTPRKRGLKYENPTGSRAHLDVLPSNWHRLEDPSEPIWGTEGIRKGDSLTTAGALAVGLNSVWQFQRGGELLPCWDNIPLVGRTVYAAYDSDAATNPNVQAALVRFSKMLSERGANVLAVRIPGKTDGGKVGIDDYLAAGGSLAALAETARPVDPEQLRRDRIKADPPLRRGLRALWAAWDAMELRTMGHYTDRSVLRVFIERAERSGRTTEGGISVTLSVRGAAMGSAVGVRAAFNSLKRLEARGYLKRSESKRAEGEAATYLLLAGEGRAARAEGKHNGGEGRKERAAGVSASEPPLSHHVSPLRAPAGEGVPELRWSAVERHRERDDRGREVVVYEYLGRLGKRCGAVVEYLLFAAGRTAEVPELMGRFASPKTRERDFRKRVLGPLEEAGLVEVGGGAVILHPDWRDRLEQARLLADEHGAARRQKTRIKLERDAYRRRHETGADRAPTEEEMDAARVRRNAHGFIEDLEREPEPMGMEELYRLIDKRVTTRLGPGRLWRAFSDEVGVVLDGNPDVVTFMHPCDVVGPGG